MSRQEIDKLIVKYYVINIMGIIITMFMVTVLWVITHRY